MEHSCFLSALVSPDLSDCCHLLFHPRPLPRVFPVFLWSADVMTWCVLSAPELIQDRLRRHGEVIRWTTAGPSIISFGWYTVELLLLNYYFENGFCVLLGCALFNAVSLHIFMLLCFCMITFVCADKCSENTSIFTLVPWFPVCFTVLPPCLLFGCYTAEFSFLWADVVLPALAGYK